MNDARETKPGSVIVHLKDGRTIDITDRSPEEGVAHLRALGVTLDDIHHTAHLISTARTGASS